MAKKLKKIQEPLQDKLVTCNHCGSNMCYAHPINETAWAYSCTGCGFTANDILKEGMYNVESFEETFPELYKDLKSTDSEGRVWYPLVMQNESGIVFINGTDKENWTWSAILNRELTEGEQQVYINESKPIPPHKSDPTTMKHFGKNGFLEAITYIKMV